MVQSLKAITELWSFIQGRQCTWNVCGCDDLEHQSGMYRMITCKRTLKNNLNTIKRFCYWFFFPVTHDYTPKVGTRTTDAIRHLNIDSNSTMQKLKTREITLAQHPHVISIRFILRWKPFTVKILRHVEVSYSARHQLRWAQKFNSHATMAMLWLERPRSLVSQAEIGAVHCQYVKVSWFWIH